MKAYDIKGNCTYDGPDEAYPPYVEERERRRNDLTVKTWVIYVKGLFGARFVEQPLGKGFTDIKYGNGTVIFRGTFANLSILEDKIFKSGVKVIGSKEYVVVAAADVIKPIS